MSLHALWAVVYVIERIPVLMGGHPVLASQGSIHL
jgi:hypothetical protein